MADDKTKKSVDSASQQMIDHALACGFELPWDRYQAQQPQCDFGGLGFCCKNCKGKVEGAEIMGCWVTCHHDSRYMPDEPAADARTAATDVAGLIAIADGITKYTSGSRTKLEYKGRGGKPRGAWDKLIPGEEH